MATAVATSCANPALGETFQPAMHMRVLPDGTGSSGVGGRRGVPEQQQPKALHTADPIGVDGLQIVCRLANKTERFICGARLSLVHVTDGSALPIGPIVHLRCACLSREPPVIRRRTREIATHNDVDVHSCNNVALEHHSNLATLMRWVSAPHFTLQHEWNITDPPFDFSCATVRVHEAIARGACW